MLPVQVLLPEQWGQPIFGRRANTLLYLSLDLSIYSIVTTNLLILVVSLHHLDQTNQIILFIGLQNNGLQI